MGRPFFVARTQSARANSGIPAGHRAVPSVDGLMAPNVETLP